MMKNHLRMALAALLLFMGGSIAFAQQKISGTIVDLSGQPVIGASVMIPGTTTGAVTNLDGKYELSVPTGSNLTVSCIGFVDQTFTVVAGQNVYNFKLSDDAEMLEETVVIGYGTVKVKDLTGSVTAVGSKDLEIPVSNVGEALQGKMAGVVVSMGSQSPGSSPTIRVRGSKSISSSNDPLVLVDGFPGSLANVPADQIKSINVLKDAASTAIYGSRGAAGVILVTTKNAIEGQTSVSYSGYVQVKDSSTEIYDVLDAEDYLKFTLGYARDYNAVNYDGMLRYFGIGANYGNKFSQYAGRASHNWQKDLLKTGISHNHNLTISTGTQRSRTMFSMNYTYDDGTVINSWYRRINANLRTTQKITNSLDFELNLAYNTSQSRGNSRQASAYQYRALDPLGPEPTNYSGFGNGSGSYIDPASDPIELTYNSEPGSSNHNFRGIASLNWRPIQGLTMRSELGLNKGFTRSESFTKGYGNTEKSASLSRGESSRLNWNTTIQYEIPFSNKNHRADIMVGNEMRMTDGQSMTYTGYDYPENYNRAQTFANLDQYIRDFNFGTSYNTPGRSVSFFSRANYALMDRYLLTLTFRADGSANFAPKKRWGYFPAAAFAWRVSDEPWMRSTRDWLSSLKLRISYGVTGSDSIGANHWRETWSLGGNGSYTISNKRYDTELDYGRAYAPGTQMQNPYLRWENTYTTNLGLDFG
ncbi:MAG: SusC/RagA family TonB-linked outer membrane protein, partial [Bacteroidales bacterium]|nr:SusC/RagA family TonB-linked outer membrane protein [Bacteroidales bacterium]